MPNWEGSDRRQRLPADWPRIVKRIKRRDANRCQVRMEGGRKCLSLASDVDHIEAGDDHSDENLRCICDWHHRQKSSSEGGAARAAQRRKVASRFKRVEDHPGLL